MKEIVSHSSWKRRKPPVSTTSSVPVMSIEMATGMRIMSETRFAARMYQLPCCGSRAAAAPKTGA